MSARAFPRMTEAEYLAFDLSSPGKHEFVNGEVVAMAGAHPAHVQVVGSLLVSLRTRLAGRPCRVLASDQRVRVDDTGLYAYPDLVVFCGRPDYAATNPPTLLNPSVLVEVASEATAAFDRGAKFAHYQRLPSLQEYLLVSWEERRVEHFRRIDARQWHLTITEGEGEVDFPTLGVTVPLAEIFAGIDDVLPA